MRLRVVASRAAEAIQTIEGSDPAEIGGVHPEAGGAASRAAGERMADDAAVDAGFDAQAQAVAVDQRCGSEFLRSREVAICQPFQVGK